MKKFYTAFVFILLFSFAHAQDAFITTWEVTNDDLSIVIPTDEDNYTYDYTVDFGDGTVETNVSGDISHTYSSEGVYTVSISGDFPKIYFMVGYFQNRKLIKTVEQWGDIEWQSMQGAFFLCSNLIVTASDSPDLSQVTDMSKMFYKAKSFNQSINTWDVSSVTDMSKMFYMAELFNQPLNSWNVSNVTNMTSMFTNAGSFNQPLSNWDVSSVTDMSNMFYKAKSFNQSINSWDVSSVTDMSKMFYMAELFNQPLNSWNVSNVSDMREMFYRTTSFNKPLNNWDVTGVEIMVGAFSFATSFNQSLNNWNVSNVESMKRMFGNTNNYNQPLGNWDVSNVTDMSYMFRDARVFNQSINSWDVSSVDFMVGMFKNATSFDQPLNGWDVSNVSNMSEMFSGPIAFNQPLNNWEVSNVSSMNTMFQDNRSFNQDLSNWNFNGNVSLFEFIDNCGLDHSNYDLLLSQFQTLNLQDKFLVGTNLIYCDGTTHDYLTENLGWSISNDALLVNCNTTIPSGAFVTTWEVSYSSITIPTVATEEYDYNVDFGDGTILNNQTGSVSHQYNYPGIYVVSITGDYPQFKLYDEAYRIRSVEQWGDIQWISMESAFYDCYKMVINADDTPDLSQVTDMSNMFAEADLINSPLNDWDVSNITNMENMFKGTSYFNKSLDNWDVSNVTNMAGMFQEAKAFNQPLNDWDVSSVTNMSNLFNAVELLDNSSFNQSIDNWDVSNVTNMSGMFASSHYFNQPLNNWDVSNVTNMAFMFSGAISFNQPINDWNVSNVSDMTTMFGGASSFNQALDEWDVSNVTKMSIMFNGASSFNQPIDNWDVGSVTSMLSMFFGANEFNKPLNNWDVSNVTDMKSMFGKASLFNQPLNNWDVSNVSTMAGMFQDAVAFNQNISDWNFASDVVFFYDYFLDDDDPGFIKSSGLNVYNYDALLARFEELGLEDKTLLANNLEYCNQGVRNELINTLGWSITGDSISEDCAFNYVSGIVHYDENNDGCDDNDMAAENFLVNANDGTYDIGSFSLADGHYNLNLLEGSYTVTLVNVPEYFTVSPETTALDFPGSGEQEQLDFCLTATQTVADLNVTILPINQARPGFEAEYQLVVENMGTQTVSGAEVSFGFDDAVQTFVSASPSPASTTGNTATFDLADLPPFAVQTLNLTLQTATPPTVNGDDILNLTAGVTPDANDNTPEDNTFEFDQEVVNSFDPNDKQVVQGDEVLIDNADQYLDYIIRFQNTGTASAINVRILDTLHPKLDYSTISPVSASHDYRVEITDNNQVEFIFDDINLPYEDEDEAGSQGFVAYKIKPKAAIEVGDVITGDASIYFDFNEPIITNMVSTTFIEDLSTESIEPLKNQLVLYPNPVKNTLNLKISENLQIEGIKIYNLQGQNVKSVQGHQETINIENLEAGLYFLDIKTTKGNLRRQVVKE